MPQTFPFAFGAALGAAAVCLVVVVGSDKFDATTATWIQGVGSILALFGAVWAVIRTARLGREQMADAQRREEWSAAEAAAKDTERMTSLVEVAMAAAISASAFVELNLEYLREPAGRQKIVVDTGIDSWLADLDHHSHVLERIPFYDLGNAIAAIAIVKLVNYMAGFRSHAVIALNAEKRGVDRSDVLANDELGLKLFNDELGILTRYRDALKTTAADHRVRAQKLRAVKNSGGPTAPAL